MKVGFAGTGVMGSRMAARLIAAGYDVTVFNRTPEKAEALVKIGAKYAPNLAGMAQKADILLTCLSMPADVEEVYDSPGGILEAIRPGCICIDFTTVGMETSRKVCQKALEKRVYYLDAPVSGGPEGAERGLLTIMVGGDLAAYQKVSPLLSVLGTNVQYLGPSGMGSAAKLLNQYLVAVHSLAASEAMVTGAALGMNAEQLFEILKTSYGDSRMLRRHVGEYILDRKFEPGGALKYLEKDLRLALPLVEKANLTDCSGQFALRQLELASLLGLGDLDMSAVILPLEKQAQVIVSKN